MTSWWRSRTTGSSRTFWATIQKSVQEGHPRWDVGQKNSNIWVRLTDPSGCPRWPVQMTIRHTSSTPKTSWRQPSRPHHLVALKMCFLIELKCNEVMMTHIDASIQSQHQLMATPTPNGCCHWPESAGMGQPVVAPHSTRAGILYPSIFAGEFQPCRKTVGNYAIYAIRTGD